MDSRILKKTIFSFFFLSNFIQPLIAGDFYLLKPKNNQSKKVSWSRSSSKNNNSSQRIFVPYSKDLNKHSNTYKSLTKYENQLPINSEEKDELDIKSDTQSEKNNILFAQGNVLVSYRGKYLNADSLIYDKESKVLEAQGNIKLIIGQQIFLMNKIKYDFVNNKGFMLKVNGLINTKNFVDDLISNFSYADIQKIESLIQINKKNAYYTPGKIDNWIFSTDEIIIDGNKWRSENAVFTNDLLEQKQSIIEINSLEATIEGEELKFNSSINYLILDEKLEIPFWFGKRTLTKSSDGFDSKNSWNIGYENLDKDGFFIGRKLNSTNLSNDFSISLEPQFLIQRALKGYTKSFVQKGDYITGERIKRDTTFSDYFALKSEIRGKINTWDLEIEKQINSFDVAKFNNALRFKSSLSKDITFLNSQWESSFYGVYRDRIWNGSLGEAEIYTGYGSRLEKQNTWEVNGVRKTEVFSFGMAKLEGEALHSKNLVSSLKGNIFYSLEQKYPISYENTTDKFVDSSFIYNNEPINEGLNLRTRIAFSSSLYEFGKHQEYLGLGAGPEFVMGSFKNKIFDYTRISFFPFYKIKSGDSLFKFDQISDKFTMNVSFDQQLYGPLVVKSNALFNLDSESSDYGNVINSKISLNWQRRSYDLGIFYQPHNHSGGIGFSLFGFE